MYRVLIVDDEALMAEALTRMISNVEGFEVTAWANNGADAVAYCKNHGADIVFMDIIMPVKSGLEASQEILAICPGIHIYILSAYSNFAHAQQALQINVNDYLLKPVSFASIKRILERYNSCYGVQLPLWEKFIASIKERQFRCVHDSLSAVTEEMFEKTQNSEQLYHLFLKLRKSIASSFSWVRESDLESDSNYAVTKPMVEKKKQMEFWLFRIVDFIFKQNSIQKYPVLMEVFQFMENHLMENISLRDITNRCAISQGYLSRIFKDRYQISVMEYLHIRKLMLAKAYLAFSQLSVAEIAFRLGYNESNYFGKVFKKFECMTAYQYRKAVMDDAWKAEEEGGEVNE